MKRYAKNFMLGMLTSLVPIILLSFYHGRMIKNDLDYPHFVRYAPWIMGFLNTLIFSFWVEPAGVENFFLIGAVFAAIYSAYGYFIEEIPQKTMNLDNPASFHIFSLIIWGLVYGVGVDYLYKNFN